MLRDDPRDGYLAALVPYSLPGASVALPYTPLCSYRVARSRHRSVPLQCARPHTSCCTSTGVLGVRYDNGNRVDTSGPVLECMLSACWH